MVPLLSLGEDLQRMSLGAAGSRAGKDPAGEASKRGKVPTLGEVQKSLKQLIKTLIQATTSMETLPRRRFANFKLFYTDDTPEDYEPVHFKAGDVDADKFFFATHDVKEPPEKTSVGGVETGHHGINVEIQSVAAYLPPADNADSPFTGLAAAGVSGTSPSANLTPGEEAVARAAQDRAQAEDAEARVVVWDAEKAVYDDADAEGDDDPDYAADKSANDSGIGMIPGLLGIRSEEGIVVPIHLAKVEAIKSVRGEDGDMDTGSTIHTDDIDEAQYAGTSEDVPLNAGALRLTHLIVDHHLTQTQELLEPTQLLPLDARTSSTMRATTSPLPPSSASGTSTPTQTQSMLQGETVPTQMLVDMIFENQSSSAPTQDTDMLDLETQVQTMGDDPIESFASATGPNEGIKVDSEDLGFACSCGVSMQDGDMCFCEGGCGKWFHLWCNGYHSSQDARLPRVFNCFGCRVRQDKNWAIISVNDILPIMTEKFERLAVFRRAIKVAEVTDFKSLNTFTKEMGCEVLLAGQLLKRLEAEGFVAVEILVDITLDRTRKQKQRVKARRDIQKAKYYFVKASKRRQAYLDYFNPDAEVEKRMMGLSEADTRPKSHRKKGLALSLTDSSNLAAQGSSRRSPTPLPPCPSVVIPPVDENGSQTQDYTQEALHPPIQPSQELKRKSTETGESRKKKVKISMARPVDLQD
ncbi:hypothetical protein FIBSPDRAFT_1044318 [Athelia psychrophila]|uniref:HORMA domain-containing protein n=1 Tax=Athelia psychrophila TaxID=1759441 RepID=A0A166JS52_9AGAM|nr:hypothetical protein FIBSPDRAFT_1044318 [Fibularhizoctonia sp. CBS 109695]